MTQSNPPKLETNTSKEYLEEFKALIPYYTPNWKPETNDESGIALTNIFTNLLEIINEKLNKMPQKNFLEFLNTMQLKLLPPNAAQVPITINPVKGIEEKVIIPKGTRVGTEPLEDGKPVIFETDSTILSTQSKISEIFHRYQRFDEIYRFSDEYANQETFSVFEHLPDKNLQEHVLYIGHKDLFTIRPRSSIVVRFYGKTADLISLKEIIEDENLSKWEFISIDKVTKERIFYHLPISEITDLASNSTYFDVTLWVPKGIGNIEEVKIQDVKSKWIQLKLIDPDEFEREELLKIRIRQFLTTYYNDITINQVYEISKLVKKNCVTCQDLNSDDPRLIENLAKKVLATSVQKNLNEAPFNTISWEEIKNCDNLFLNVKEKKILEQKYLACFKIPEVDKICAKVIPYCQEDLEKENCCDYHSWCCNTIHVPKKSIPELIKEKRKHYELSLHQRTIIREKLECIERGFGQALGLSLQKYYETMIPEIKVSLETYPLIFEKISTIHDDLSKLVEFQTNVNQSIEIFVEQVGNFLENNSVSEIPIEELEEMSSILSIEKLEKLFSNIQNKISLLDSYVLNSESANSFESLNKNYKQKFKNFSIKLSKMRDSLLYFEIFPKILRLPQEYHFEEKEVPPHINFDEFEYGTTNLCSSIDTVYDKIIYFNDELVTIRDYVIDWNKKELATSLIRTAKQEIELISAKSSDISSKISKLHKPLETFLEIPKFAESVQPILKTIEKINENNQEIKKLLDSTPETIREFKSLLNSVIFNHIESKITEFGSSSKNFMSNISEAEECKKWLHTWTQEIIIEISESMKEEVLEKTDNLLETENFILPQETPMGICNRKPNYMFHNNRAIDVNTKFFPLGSRPYTNDIFYIGDDEAFSKKCNMATVEINYDDDVNRDRIFDNRKFTKNGGNAFDDPIDVAIHNSGKIIVTERGSNRIQIFDSNGIFFKSITQANGVSFNGLSGMTVDNFGDPLTSGRIIVVDTYNHRIVILNSDGSFNKAISEVGPNDPFNAPLDVAVDGLIEDIANPGRMIADPNQPGRIIVVDENNARIVIFNPDGSVKKIISEVEPNDPFNQLVCVTTDRFKTSPNSDTYNGRIIVADGPENQRRIVIFDHDGVLIQKISEVEPNDPFGKISGVSTNRMGIMPTNPSDIVVTDGEKNRLIIFDANGIKKDIISDADGANGEFSFPSGISFDSNYNMFVADSSNNRIQIFNSQGQFIKSITGDTSITGKTPHEDNKSILIWEYFDGEKWQKLEGIKENPNNPSPNVDQSLQIPIPCDIEKTTVNDQESYWFRVRLFEGDFGNEKYIVEEVPGQSRTSTNPVPNRYKFYKKDPIHAPKIIELKTTFSSELEEVPNRMTLNNLDYKNYSGVQIPFKPFEMLDESKSSIYLGFDKKIEDGPLSLYFNIKEEYRKFEEQPAVNFYYYSNGWNPLQINDQTNGLTKSATVKILVPDDFEQSFKFGKNLYWIKISNANKFLCPRKINSIYTNTVMAYNSIYVQNELVGSGDDFPNQKISLENIPIFEKPIKIWVREENLDELEIKKLKESRNIKEIKDEQGNVKEIWTGWNQVQNFNGSKLDRHFLADKTMREITFGDGKNSKIPMTLDNNITADYFTGGGVRGNLPANTINSTSKNLPFVDSVTNNIPSDGGNNHETLNQLLRRGPHTLKNRDQAISIDDYEWIIKEKFRSVYKVSCFPTITPEGITKGGHVSIVIIPYSDEKKPMPTIMLQESIYKILAARSPPTIKSENLHILAPKYIKTNVKGKIFVKTLGEIPTVETLVKEKLEKFLHPITGGHNNDGWEFGEVICLADIYTIIESIPGVDHVDNLSLEGIFDESKSLAFTIDNSQQKIIEYYPHSIIYGGDFNFKIGGIN